jgi:twitching motility two-component system response regulator PilH
LLTESFRPHVILLDYLLPDINGNIVCQRLREREDLASTRVLFISGVVSADELGRLRDSGADGFLHKPFDVDALLSKIEELLSTDRA